MKGRVQMARVSKEYGLKLPLPFVDVRLEVDNRLFIDPSALRNSAGDPLKHRAHLAVESFFSEVIRCRFSKRAGDARKGEGLLKRLNEPNETRLGLSAENVAGHGFGDVLANRLWRELESNPACVASVLTKLEDVTLFVKDVGADLVSDLTTRVTFGILADFTKEMVRSYPSLGRELRTAVSPIWDQTARTWVEEAIELPFVEGRQLLLVPRDWVYWRLLMNSEQFYTRHSTQTLKEEATTYDSRGRAHSPRKKDIVKANPDRRLLNNNQAVKYKDDDLVGQYREWVDAGYEPMDDDALAYRLGSL